MIWNPFKADREIKRLYAEKARSIFRTCASCEWSSGTINKISKELNEAKAVNIILREQIEKLYQEKMELYKENDRLAHKLKDNSAIEV
jgi:hypothetical protein